MNPNSAPYSDCKVLVTGHTGFKGSWLTACLCRFGAEVVGYALSPPTEPALFDLAELGQTVDDRRGDVRDSGRLSAVVAEVRPAIVFHLAARAIVRESYKEPKETFDVNVSGTVNLLDALRQSSSVRAIVVVTSDKCYENLERDHAYRETDRIGGVDPYSASKACAEHVVSAYYRSYFEREGIGVATVRAGNVIGGGDWARDRIIPDIVRAIEDGKPVTVRNPEYVRPWQHVLDPLAGYISLAARLCEDPGGFSGPWNFGPEIQDCRTVRELVTAFLSAYGRGEWEESARSEALPRPEAHMLKLSCDKARRMLDWRPRWPFDDAVRRTALWYRCFDEDANPMDLCLSDISSFTNEADACHARART